MNCFLLLVIFSVPLLQLVFYVFGKSKIRRHGQSVKAAPDGLPLVGHVIKLLQPHYKLYKWFSKCEKQFGFETFTLSGPTLPPGVVINDPKNLEFVLKNEGIFSKGDFFKSRSWDLFGNGIINADGELWKLQRKAGLHFLNSSNLKALTDVALPKYLANAVQGLEAKNQDQVVDLDNVFHEITTKIMGRMAYDMDMRASDEFSIAFDYASGATGERFQNPLWKITENFTGARLRKSLAEIRRFGKEIVASAIHQPEKNRDTDPNLKDASGSLINSLLDSISDQQLVADAALNYLSAGKDTTAQALTWTFYELMRHPLAVASIIEEIQHQHEESEPGVESAHPVTSATLPFTVAVFYEALRLHPPVPFEIKELQSDATLPDGTFLPKSSIVIWCPWAMNRSTLIWGDDPESFRPQRWIEDGKLITKTAFEFPVFNGGPRTCLGKKMAESIALMVIVALVSEFDFTLASMDERHSKNSLTLPMEGGLPCYVKVRQAW